MVAESSRPSCYLALGKNSEAGPIGSAIRKAVLDAGFRVTLVPQGTPAREHSTVEAIAISDCFVAEITEHTMKVAFEIGNAHALGKPIFLLSREPLISSGLDKLVVTYWLLHYQRTASGLKNLTTSLTSALREQRRAPFRPASLIGSKNRSLFAVDWDRLSGEDVENLCLELLSQLGYRRVNWDVETREFDILAELPKKDPDGYEYRELWMVSFGWRRHPRELLDIARHDPEYLVDKLIRTSEHRLRSLVDDDRASIPLTLLIILPPNFPDQPNLFPNEQYWRSNRATFYVRVRTWDRNYLTSLVYQFPQIGFKYFSDEQRSRSKYRKTPDELYHETVALNTKLSSTLAALKSEKDKRIRAERDAIWKDISFSAAHKMGNPIFAIETNLDPLQRRIVDSRRDEAIAVVASIRNSVEKAKGIVDQFKSLTKAQELNPIMMKLRPVIEDSCSVAIEHGVSCHIDCSPEVEVYADPERLAEVFDELVCNSLHWFNKDTKNITVTVSLASSELIPKNLSQSLEYVVVHFLDNGSGVLLENKSKIFDAFFTTHDHGTGIGLALVRRIVEGLGGGISESGLPTHGADFEFFLPVTGRPSKEDSR